MVLLYFFLLLWIYVIGSLSLEPIPHVPCLNGYLVHDAGTLILNGCFVLNGSAFGAPRYILITNRTYSMYRYENQWTIGVQGKEACYKAISHKFTSQVPPCKGWSIASVSKIMCPNVDIGTPTLTAPPNASASTPVKPCAVLPPTPPPTPTPPMELVLEDDFNQELNRSTWNVLEQIHRGGVYTRENVYTKNGSLVLRTIAQNISIGDQKYFVSSGAVNTSNLFAQRFGRWEIRAKMPDVDRTSGYTLHSSFWLYSPGQKGNSGCAQELDILEQYPAHGKTNRDSSLKGTIHSFTGGSGKKCHRFYGETFSTTTADYTSDWHIHVFEWTEEQLTVQIDGRTIGTFLNTTVIATMTDPLYTLLTACVMNQVPPTLQDVLPQYYYIDYIKVWKWV